MADGKKVRACLVARRRQVPDLKDGSVEMSGSVSLCSSHLQFMGVGELECLWPLWGTRCRNAYGETLHGLYIINWSASTGVRMTATEGPVFSWTMVVVMVMGLVANTV